jgi:hypothetical protein
MLWTLPPVPGGSPIVQLDANGDKKVDFSIQLDGHHALTIDDFIF